MVIVHAQLAQRRGQQSRLEDVYRPVVNGHRVQTHQVYMSVKIYDTVSLLKGSLREYDWSYGVHLGLKSCGGDVVVNVLVKWWAECRTA